MAEANSSAKTDYDERFFNASDGLRLYYRRWAAAEPKGIIGLVHGFAEHSGRYDELALDLVGGGYTVAAFDYRGHGQSGGRRAHIDAFDEYMDDLKSFLVEMEREGLAHKPILLGHSQGGLLVARLAELVPEVAKALVLSSPFFGLAMKVPAVKLALAKAVSMLIPTLSMPSGVDSAWLSHDRAVVERYAADPLVSQVATARWFTETVKAQASTLADAGKIKLPTVVLQAGDDKLASLDATRKFFSALGSEDKQLEIYSEYFHEIFNEVGRDKVVADLLAWLEAHA
ncbi:MAG: lysophospholipase [Deltaproteobacteria bacterium]|nr:lysophospholipase [Deltaproteobacteria bacterium]